MTYEMKMEDYRPCKDGEYWDIFSEKGQFRKVGFNEKTVLNWLQQERVRAISQHEQHLKNLSDLEIRILEGIRE